MNQRSVKSREKKKKPVLRFDWIQENSFSPSLSSSWETWKEMRDILLDMDSNWERRRRKCVISISLSLSSQQCVSLSVVCLILFNSFSYTFEQKRGHWKEKKHMNRRREVYEMKWLYFDCSKRIKNKKRTNKRHVNKQMNEQMYEEQCVVWTGL